MRLCIITIRNSLMQAQIWEVVMIAEVTISEMILKKKNINLNLKLMRDLVLWLI